MNDWRALAVCRGLPPRLFYDDGTNGRATTRRAITICHTCPVIIPCRYEALEIRSDEQFGTRGGLTAKQRIAVRRQWRQIDWSVMRPRRAAALAESWRLRHTEAAA